MSPSRRQAGFKLQLVTLAHDGIFLGGGERHLAARRREGDGGAETGQAQSAKSLPRPLVKDRLEFNLNS
jgi:hypothetical protein